MGRKRKHQPVIGLPKRGFRFRGGASISEAFFGFGEFLTGSYLAYKALDYLNLWWVQSPPAAYSFRPSAIILLMPPLMAFTALIPLSHDRLKLFFFSRILRRSLPAGWNNPPLDKGFHKFFLVFGWTFLLLSICLIPIHTNFSETQITAAPMFPFPERIHKYSEVKKIYLAYVYNQPSNHNYKGSWSRNRELFIQFASGDNWRTTSGLAEIAAEQRLDVARYVSARSGVPIEIPDLGSAPKTIQDY